MYVFCKSGFCPKADNLQPAYGQAHFPDSEKHNNLRLLVAPANENGALSINQDVRLYASILDKGASVQHQIKEGRAAWIQMVDGLIEVNGKALKSGDGAQIEDMDNIEIKAQKDSEFLLFDLV